MDAKGFLSGSEVEGAMFNETDTEYLQAFNEYQKTGVDPMGGSWSSKTFSIDQAQYQAGLKYIDNVGEKYGTSINLKSNNNIAYIKFEYE